MLVDLSISDFTQFLSQSPTSFHASRELAKRLKKEGFSSLSMETPWNLKKGGKYFVLHEGSLSAFILPEKELSSLALVVAHTDSPALKLKPQPDISKKSMHLLGVEIYGSPILPSWFNRDLAIAGRVFVTNDEQEIESHLVFFEDAPLIIPLIAPHLEREDYKGGMKLSPQEHVVPLAGCYDSPLDKKYIEILLRKNLSFQSLVDFELFLIPLESPRLLGEKQDLLASYRLDNLASTYASFFALSQLQKASSSLLPCAFFWDHEEIGSGTSSGAKSPFFRDVYTKIVEHYQFSSEEEISLRYRSFCISADMAHAFNPNYENKYDPHHLPLLGKGVVVKYQSNRSYSTSGKSGAQLIALCKKAGVDYQLFANRTDLVSGSTVGPIFSTQMGIETVDIGIAQLSMHAAREILACKDLSSMYHLLHYFFSHGISQIKKDLL